jgi:predicted amidophosphoribosyltransferase
VLLVDDVYTTGATLDACATALRAVGCRTVKAIAFARTLDGPPRRLYDDG